VRLEPPEAIVHQFGKPRMTVTYQNASMFPKNGFDDRYLILTSRRNISSAIFTDELGKAAFASAPTDDATWFRIIGEDEKRYQSQVAAYLAKNPWFYWDPTKKR
jgi:hypothetical protein